MKLVLHIVGKDFLRLRGWLAGWALLLVGEVGVGWLVRSGDWGGPGLDWLALTTAVHCLAGLNLGIVFPLTLLLVQEDALAGTQQFWITRPISGMRLLAAKSIGVIIIFGGLPVLVALPWWLSCGFGLRELAWATMETVVLHAVIALPAMLVAALTDSVQRAFLWTLVLVAAAASGVVMWEMFVAPGTNEYRVDLAWARTWMALTVLALGMAGAVVVQFLGRKFSRSLAVFGGGLASAVAIAGWWPVRWTSGYHLTEAHAERAAAITLKFASAVRPDWKTDPHSRDEYLRVRMTAHGVPPDRWLLGDETMTHTWRWPGGPVLVRYDWGPGGDTWGGLHHAVRTSLGLREPTADPETEQALRLAREKMYHDARERRARVGLPPLPPSAPPPPPAPPDAVALSASAPVPRSLVARMQTEPPAYEARVWLQLLRPELVIETPLRVGDWQSQAARRMRVTRTDRPTSGETAKRLDDTIHLTLVETRPTTWEDDWSLVFFPRNYRLHQHEGERMFALNRAQGTMEQLNHEARQVRICSVQILWHGMGANVAKISRGGKWVDTQPAWLDGATIALVQFPEEARFKREVKVERFEVTK